MWLDRWKTKLRLCASLLLVSPLLTGCWDRLEIEQRATVLGIAIDAVDQDSESESSTSENQNSDTGGTTSGTTENIEASAPDDSSQESDDLNEPSKDTTGSDEVKTPAENYLHLTAQIAVPGRIPLGPGEGGGGSTSSQQAVWVLHSSGKTLNDALQRLQQKVADRLFYGHLRVIVVSDKFARQPGLEGMTDTLRRNPEIRRTAWLIVAKDSAENIMEAAPPLERVPTLYLMSTMEHATQLGKLPNEPLGAFVSHVLMQGRDPVLPYVETAQRNNVHVRGLAHFSSYRMVGSSERPIEVSTYMQLIGQRTGGYAMTVSVPGTPGTVMWHAVRRKTRMKVDIQHGVPHFTINVHLDGNIIGKSSEDIDVGDPRVVHKIDQELRRRAMENMMVVIDRAKSTHTDIFGFGELVRAKKAWYWDRYIRNKQKWDEVFPTITVSAYFSIRTHRIGMKGN